MRIISLCPSNTEVLGYLAADQNIVGVDNYSTWPPSIQDLPRLGSDLRINMDRVEELQPDLVLASLTVPGMEKNIEELEKRGLPFITLQPHHLQDIKHNLEIVGNAIGKSERAKQAVHAFEECIKEYRSRSQSIVSPTHIYWEWWPKPVFTPGGGNWLTEISKLAGAQNVFADDARASVKTDLEDVRRRNPDTIALVWVGIQQDKVNPELVLARENWNQVTAVREQRVYVLDEPLFCRPSPKLLTGMCKLAALLHPDVFPSYQDGYDPLLDRL